MKERIFSFVWAAICAWATVHLLLWLDTKLEFSELWFFPAMLEYFHEWGLPITFRQVLFFGLLLTYWFTGLHKYVGYGILMAIGFTVILVIAILLILLGYQLVMWMAGSFN